MTVYRWSRETPPVTPTTSLSAHARLALRTGAPCPWCACFHPALYIPCMSLHTCTDLLNQGRRRVCGDSFIPARKDSPCMRDAPKTICMGVQAEHDILHAGAPTEQPHCSIHRQGPHAGGGCAPPAGSHSRGASATSAAGAHHHFLHEWHLHGQ